MEKKELDRNYIIPLRGHHLMCFHGYRGMGYNQEFIDCMTWLKNMFIENPTTLIQVKSSPDMVCDSCPHLGENGCTEGEPNKEAKISEFDRRVMEIVGIREGQTLTVEDAFDLVEENISPDMLHELCKNCDWLQYGYCSSGIRKGFYSI